MIDTEKDATEKEAQRAVRSGRTTSVLTWLLVVAAAIVLLLIRMPQFIAVAEAALQTQSAALGDAELSVAAITIGAATAVALHVIGIVLIAALATLMERLLGPRALGKRLRIGVGGATLAILVLGQQIAAAAMGVAAVERGWPLWIAGALVALSTPLLFPAARTSLRGYARALPVTGVIGGLLCVG